jgi:hypothetical protein
MSYAGACGNVSSGQSLMAGQSTSSCDGRFTLAMQTDGNLVLYWNGHGALWASGTYQKGGVRATMQADGNLVVYNSGNGALWASGTSGHAGSKLAVQNDGNLVIYQGSAAIWASNTSGH